jgi:hypothetical protein
MTKNKVISQLRQMSKCHLDWRLSVLVSNMDIPVNSTPRMTIDDCGFDEWYLENKKWFGGIKSFDKLEKFHLKSIRICKALKTLEKQKVGKLKQILFGYDELVNKKKIEAYYKDLSKASKKFIARLNELENQIKDLPNEEFDQLRNKRFL